MRIALKLFLRQHRRAVGATSESYGLRRHQNPDARRNPIMPQPSPRVALSSASPDRFQVRRAPRRRAQSRSSRLELRRSGGRRRCSLHHHGPESHATRAGALSTGFPRPASRCQPKQVRRRQPMSPCDRRDLVPPLIALCENPYLLLRHPFAPSARSGEDPKPSNRLCLRLVQS